MRKKRATNQLTFSFTIFDFDIFEIGFKPKGHVIFSKSTNKEESTTKRSPQNEVIDGFFGMLLANCSMWSIYKVFSIQRY